MKTLSNVWLYSGFLPSPSLSLSPPPGKGKKRDPGNDAVIAVASHFFFFFFFVILLFTLHSVALQKAFRCDTYILIFDLSPRGFSGPVQLNGIG